MVKVTVLLGVEFYLAGIVKTRGNKSIRCDGLDDGKVAIGDAERLVRRGELYAVTRGKLVRDFPVYADADEPAWIVIGELPCGFFEQ